MKTVLLRSVYRLKRCVRLTNWAFLPSCVKCALKGKRFKFFLFLSFFGGYLWLVFATLHPPLPSAKKPLIFYSTQLRDDLKMTVIRAIKKAKISITLQIYGLTDPDILTLLEKKKGEGLDIQIFYDKKASTPLLPFLDAHPVKASGLMHRKILIVDQQLVLIGTANFTTPSLKMHGNTIAGIFDPSLAQFLQESIETEKHFTLKDGTLTSYLFPDLENLGFNKIQKCIEQASTSIHIAMFTLTHPKIVKKLIHAQQRGVEVIMVVDRFTAKGASSSAIKTLREAGAKIRTSQGDQLLHYKWALIDGQTLIMGSANWTKAAFEQNQDCLLVFEHLTPLQKKRLAKLWKAIAIASQTL